VVSPHTPVFHLFFIHILKIGSGWVGNYLLDRSNDVDRSGDGWREAELTSQPPWYPAPWPLLDNQWAYCILVVRWLVLPPSGLCALAGAGQWLPPPAWAWSHCRGAMQWRHLSTWVESALPGLPPPLEFIFLCGSYRHWLVPHFAHFQ